MLPWAHVKRQNVILQRLDQGSAVGAVWPWRVTIVCICVFSYLIDYSFLAHVNGEFLNK